MVGCPFHIGYVRAPEKTGSSKLGELHSNNTHARGVVYVKRKPRVQTVQKTKQHPALPTKNAKNHSYHLGPQMSTSPSITVYLKCG